MNILFRLMVMMLLMALLMPMQLQAAPGDISKAAGNGLWGFSGDGGAAISARFLIPTGLALDGSGNLYIADQNNQRIRKIDTAGIITTVAGTGAANYSGDGGAATAATFRWPSSVVVDGSGNLYIADTASHRVRKVDAAGIISTVAGTGVGGYNGDGIAATTAQINRPVSLVIDGSGNLYIAEKFGYRVRKVDTAGIISTVAGTGAYGSTGDGGAATAAKLASPTAIAMDGSGNLYIGDYTRVRKVDAAGNISTVAGTGIAGSTGDGGPATAAKIQQVMGIVVDGFGRIFFSEQAGHRVRMVDTAGNISTVAGTGIASSTGDGGPATTATLNQPYGLAMDAAGDLYVSEFNGHVIRKIINADLTATISSTATSPTSNPVIPVTLTFNGPVTGVSVADLVVGNGSAGNFVAVSSTVYTADITAAADGAVTVDVAANSANDSGGVGNRAAAQFSITYASAAPTLTISSTATSPTVNQVIPVILTFSEAVTGISVADLIVGNGSASNFVAVSSTVYSADITATGYGAVTVDVAANSANDLSGLGNTASAQFSIAYGLASKFTTTFADNAKSYGYGPMFDVTATNAISIIGFDINSSGNATVKVYYKQGSYVGSQTNAAAWTLLGAADVISAGKGVPTALNIGGLTIGAGQTVGIFMTSNNWFYDTNGNRTYSNADLSLTAGALTTASFSQSVNARSWNGNIHYSHLVTNTISSIDISADTGSSATDFITATAAQTITGILSAPLAAGETLYGSVDAGATWTDVTAKVSGTAISWDGATLAGTSSIKFKVTDAAAGDGAGATQAYALDTAAPTANFTTATDNVGSVAGSLSSGDTTDDTALVLSGTNVSGSSINVYNNTTLLGAATVSGTNWSYTATIANGTTYLFNVKETDAAGNTSSATSNFTVIGDAAAPTANLGAATDNVGTVTGALSSGDTTDDTALVLSGTNTSGSSVNVYNNTTLLGAATISGTSWSYTATIGNGTTYLFNVKETDAAGNRSVATSNFTVVGDTAAPTISSVSIPNVAMKIGDAVPVTIIASEAGLTLSSGTINGVAVSGFTDNSDNSYSALYTVVSGSADLAAGADIPVNVVLSDATGNSSAAYTTAINQSADSIDSNAPVLTVAADVTINATGLFTPVTLGVATATDAVDGALTPTSDAATHYQPGTHTVTWSITDAAGNSSTATQMVNVIPLVNLSVDQNSAEGATASFDVTLNGAPVTYPVTVPYTVSGTALTDGSDHNLVNGSVTINAPDLSATVNVAIVNNGVGEGVETMIVTLATPSNAVVGANTSQTTTIYESNVAPAISLSADQGAGATRLVELASANVVVTASTVDPNPGDTQSHDWTATDNALVDLDAVANSFTFTPNTAGTYTLRLTTTDSGGLSDTAELTITVVATLPVLAAVDSDGDGVNDDIEGTGDSDGDGIPDYLDSSVVPGNALQQQQAVSDQFMIETDPGLTLGMGNVGLRSGGYTAGVTAAEVANNANDGAGAAADTGFNYVNGLFDFEVAGLPVAGQSVNIVVPQLAALPANAVYRKLMPAGWANFVVNANNSVASAAGAAGFCPAPDDAAYTAGLTAGHWCVRLMIEDGGPNDADGAANGLVKDPGGVTAAAVAAAPAPAPIAPPAPVPTSIIWPNNMYFVAGDSFTLSGAVTPDVLMGRAADVYVTITPPQGQAIYLQFGGAMSLTPAPYVSSWSMTDFSGAVFNYTFMGAEPQGLYGAELFFTEPGTMTRLGLASNGSFYFF